jgi:hypothetical protein
MRQLEGRRWKTEQATAQWLHWTFLPIGLASVFDIWLLTACFLLACGLILFVLAYRQDSGLGRAELCFSRF